MKLKLIRWGFTYFVYLAQRQLEAITTDSTQQEREGGAGENEHVNFQEGVFESMRQKLSDANAEIARLNTEIRQFKDQHLALIGSKDERIKELRNRIAQLEDHPLYGQLKLKEKMLSELQASQSHDQADQTELRRKLDTAIRQLQMANQKNEILEENARKRDSPVKRQVTQLLDQVALLQSELEYRDRRIRELEHGGRDCTLFNF